MNGARGAAPGTRPGPRARTAVLCAVADQGVAALTNIAVLVVAARLGTAPGFAAFSLVYMAATVLLGLAAGYVGQALVLRRGPELPAACRSALGFTGAASCALGLACAAGAALAPLDGATPRAFTALGLVLPLVLGQDGQRYCFSALRLPHRALGCDALRLAVTVPALAVQPAGSGPARLVAVWGLSALPALVLGGALLLPRLRGVRGTPRALLRRDHLGRRFAVEFAVGNGSSQLAVLALGLLADPLAVGALRGAATLYGPMNVLCNAATAFGPPLLRRTAGADGTSTGRAAARGTVRATALLAVALAVASAGWTAVLTALPDRAGRRLLGATWSAAAGLLPATGSQYAAIACATSALLALRVLRPRSTLPLQVVFSPLSVGLLAAGYALAGTFGAAWGLAAGSALKATALWLRAATLRRAGPQPGPPPPPPAPSPPPAPPPARLPWSRTADTDTDTDTDTEGEHRHDRPDDPSQAARLQRRGL